MSIDQAWNDEVPRPGIASRMSAKFVQICASQDDLFALDGDGNIFQYNFQTKVWGKLVASRSDEKRA